MKTLAVVLAVPTLLLGWQWWSDRSTEATLRPVASAIAGREVQVDCQTLWGALIDPLPRHGEVRFDAAGIPENRIFLTHETCDRLEDFADNGSHPELDCLTTIRWSAPDPLDPAGPCYREAADTVYALLTLAHEAYHTAGVASESTTNCYATQSLAYAARALGAREDEALHAAAAMAALLPYQRGAYSTRDCVAGSPLDLHPETPAFPSEVPLRPLQGRGGRPGIAAGA